MSENKREDEPVKPSNYDYERVMSQEEIDASWRVAGRSPEEEAQLEKIVDANVRAVRRAIYHEADMAFDDPEHTKELADLAWEDGWRHGTEFAQAALARRRPVLNPSRPISLRRLGELIDLSHGPVTGAKNATRLWRDWVLTGKVAARYYGRPDAKTRRVIVDLDDVAREWPGVEEYGELKP